MKAGFVFEEAFSEALRAVGCMAVQCDLWDLREKTDTLVMRVDGKHLHHPVEVQVTLQCDNFLKLSSYLAAIDGRRKGEMRRSLYVEAEQGVTPQAAARAVKDSVAAISLDKRAPGPWGLRVAPGGARRFDPRVRLSELAVLVSPERSATLRTVGRVVDVREHGMLLTTASRGMYWSFDGDVVDRVLMLRLRRHREARRSAFGLHVSFIADGRWHEHGRAKYACTASNEAADDPDDEQ